MKTTQQALYEIMRPFGYATSTQCYEMAEAISKAIDARSPVAAPTEAPDSARLLQDELKRAKTLHFNYVYEVSRIASQQAAICNFPETDAVRLLIDNLYDQHAVAAPESAEPSAVWCEYCGVDRSKEFCPLKGGQMCQFVSTALATSSAAKGASDAG